MSAPPRVAYTIIQTSRRVIAIGGNTGLLMSQRMITLGQELPSFLHTSHMQTDRGCGQM